MALVRPPKVQSGFALVEILVAIAILVVLSAMTYETFSAVRSHKALDTDADRIMTELSEARSLALASKDASEWGVHIASTSITLFEGASYSAGASSNVVVPLSPLVSMFSIHVPGGGSDIVFHRLSGETSGSASTTLALVSSSTMQHTITIYQTGAIEMQ